MIVRTIVSGLFIVSVFFSPWWMFVPFALLLLTFYQSYLLVIAAGVMLDITYGASVVGVPNYAHLYTILFLILIFITVFLKRQLLD